MHAQRVKSARTTCKKCTEYIFQATEGQQHQQGSDAAMENRLQELEHWKGTMLSTNAMFSDVKELENYLLERIEAQVCVSVCVYEREEAQKSVREPRCL